MVRFSHVVALGLLVLSPGLFACAGAMGPTPQELLDRTIFTYNQHLRWKRFDKAADFVAQGFRKDFGKAFEDSEETLSIEDLEVKDLSYEKETRAKVTVDARFFKLPSVTVTKAKWVQIWEQRDEGWELVENPVGPLAEMPASQPASAPIKK